MCWKVVCRVLKAIDMCEFSVEAYSAGRVEFFELGSRICARKSDERKYLECAHVEWRMLSKAGRKLSTSCEIWTASDCISRWHTEQSRKWWGCAFDQKLQVLHYRLFLMFPAIFFVLLMVWVLENWVSAKIAKRELIGLPTRWQHLAKKLPNDSSAYLAYGWSCSVFYQYHWRGVLPCCFRERRVPLQNKTNRISQSSSSSTLMVDRYVMILWQSRDRNRTEFPNNSTRLDSVLSNWTEFKLSRIEMNMRRLTRLLDNFFISSLEISWNASCVIEIGSSIFFHLSGLFISLIDGVCYRCLADKAFKNIF